MLEDLCVHRSLKKGGTGVKVPLFKVSYCGLGVSPAAGCAERCNEAGGVDLGGSKRFATEKRTFQTSSYAHFQTEFQILNLHKVINTIIKFLIILFSASTFMS
jgi:hypothetical protein